MKTVVKTAVAAALVMGFASFANAAGTNTGNVTFSGTIEDSPCSIVVGDEHQTVNLGHIGTGSLTNGGQSSAVDFHIGLENCAFTTETTMNTVFSAAGNESTANKGNIALMGANGEMEGSSIVLATYKGAQIKLGDTDVQNLVVDAAGKGLADQTLNFKAWVQGDATTTTIDTGEFSSVVNFAISYL
ncbi:fimbrial major subunit StfA [Salmonella enterica]|uniref:Fimbrial major subunit StfA n=3 Tax=Salmonella enterica TaxID=28901 RepID=A0A753VRQ5_SALER|nr:fimbrial protein [Salmonella enterica subsp. enterica serovar Koketime]EAB8205860.1 fimbrial protein [Salmonella enterica subsp. enterica serovar Lattenkamp]EAM8931283.1 fimbrial major subunit StfA [Salmonella enterica]ECJ3922793.1 fimbrial major subunit StfA [Salmonella enterica subsp. enterica]EHG3458658.1 fimbrial major subunit StfA [Salmonella enterica subsp. enterica serovar Moero]